MAPSVLGNDAMAFSMRGAVTTVHVKRNVPGDMKTSIQVCNAWLRRYQHAATTWPLHEMVYGYSMCRSEP